VRTLARSGLTVSLAAALLAACGGLRQPFGSAQGDMPLWQPMLYGNGKGTIFAMSTSGKETVIHRFGGSSDGANPTADLVEVNGTLYGTTYAGGKNGDGTVFAVTTSGEETVLHSFGGSGDGSSPAAGLINVKGTLYGTTLYGGAYGYGTVYSITPSGAETVVHSFKGARGDGGTPASRLVDIKGTLYGTTEFGGSGPCGGALTEYDGCGTVFSMTIAGKVTVLHNFDGDHGWRPYAGLVNVSGTLYGTTVWLPQGVGHGIVFKITPSGTEATVHVFQGAPSDGADAYTSLVDVNGTLYGTTSKGGKKNRGTLYSITSSGSEKMVHSFGAREDGSFPYSDLIDVSDTLYGTTYKAGTEFGGTVFSATTAGKETVLHDFGSLQKGRHPYAGLIDVNGTLYGTTKF
jgi:uncharacterized repeat protein (TIGR03803 family)